MIAASNGATRIEARCIRVQRDDTVMQGRRGAWVAAGVVLLTMLVSCASITPPQAWEKGELAKPAMQFDPDPLVAKGTQHIYTSKEGAAGGYGVGGGGCGCN